MAVRGSELRLSFSAKKRPIPISSPIPLPLTMGTTGPPGVEVPAEKGFIVFVYLPQTVCMVVYGQPHPACLPSPAGCALGSPQRHAFH